MLEVRDIHTYYGDSHVLHGVNLEVSAGTCVALLGRNGAGKTTTLKSILGYTPPRQGTIAFQGRDIGRMATFKIIRQGIGYVPEDRGIFPSLTVDEHFRVAFSQTSEGAPRRTAEEIYDFFPRLGERRRNYGNQLSGGEQQMVAIGRALIGEPELLILDEPSEGLAPVIIDQLEEAFHRIKQSGKTMLLVEQNYHLATSLADQCFVLVHGTNVWSGSAEALEANDEVKRQHLGV